VVKGWGHHEGRLLPTLIGVNWFTSGARVTQVFPSDSDELTYKPF
jgi:hypothetical protein